MAYEVLGDTSRNANSLSSASINSDDAIDLLKEYRSPEDARAQRRTRGRCLAFGRYLIYAMFALSYIFLLLAHLRSSKFYHSCESSALGLEGAYNDAPLDTHRQVFVKAGFHDGPPNKYEGRPNEVNTQAWDELLSVGMISISEEENNRLPMGGTAHVRNDWGPIFEKYVVETSVSHQLHCLKKLREVVWDSEVGKVETFRYGHASHCIDYLRQSLMCHGDLTPIYFKWSDEAGLFVSQQESIMQCRSWDAIVAWSAARNDTGLPVDGDHGKNRPGQGFVGEDAVKKPAAAQNGGG